MTTSRFTNLLLGVSLLMTSMACTETATIYSPSDHPAIQFAANDLQQALENQGNSSEIMSISKVDQKQKQTQFVFGLNTDDLLLQRLKLAGGRDLKTLAPEGYSIRITHKNNHPTVWAIGVDATGAMYAGLALAETVAQDGIKGIKEADSEPYIRKRGLKMNLVVMKIRGHAQEPCNEFLFSTHEQR